VVARCGCLHARSSPRRTTLMKNAATQGPHLAATRACFIMFKALKPLELNSEGMFTCPIKPPYVGTATAKLGSAVFIGTSQRYPLGPYLRFCKFEDNRSAFIYAHAMAAAALLNTGEITNNCCHPKDKIARSSDSRDRTSDTQCDRIS
jgi:hypothetical protein